MSRKFTRNSLLLLLTAIAIITVGCLGGGSKSDPVTHTVTIDVEGEGTVEPVKTLKVNDGATVDFKAHPAENWEFDKWIVDGDEKADREFSLVVKKDLTAIAVFKEINGEPTPIEDPPGDEPTNYTLTMKIEGEGIPTPDVGQHVIQAGEQIELSIRTTYGWKFSKWIIKDENGTEEEKTQRTTIEMDSNKEITAVFEKEAPPEDNTITLTLNIIGEGTVTLQEGYGLPKIVQPGEYQFESRDYVSFGTEATDGWKAFSWDVRSSSGWGTTLYHHEEYKNLQLLSDTEVTIVFSDQLNHVYTEAEYIFDSLPKQRESLYAINQTRSRNDIAGPYIPGFEVELETYTRRGGTSGRERVHDEFRGWVIESRETGEELPAEQYFADPKAEITTLTMPSETVTVTAEWIRFFKRFSDEGSTSTGLQSAEDDITKHYVDLSALNEGEQFTFKFSAVQYPSSYKVFYGTWDSIIEEQVGALVFDTHWVSTHPHMYEDKYNDIRYPHWHDKVYWENVSRITTGGGGVFENLITKEAGLDYVLIIMYNKNARYSFTKN